MSSVSKSTSLLASLHNWIQHYIKLLFVCVYMLWQVNYSGIALGRWMILCIYGWRIFWRDTQFKSFKFSILKIPFSQSTSCMLWRVHWRLLRILQLGKKFSTMMLTVLENVTLYFFLGKKLYLNNLLCASVPLSVSMAAW